MIGDGVRRTPTRGRLVSAASRCDGPAAAQTIHSNPALHKAVPSHWRPTALPESEIGVRRRPRPASRALPLDQLPTFPDCDHAPHDLP